MPRLLLYVFRYKSPVTGKWVKARYVAELHEIREQYAEFELIGEPEVREVREWVGFNPYRKPGELLEAGTKTTDPDLPATNVFNWAVQFELRPTFRVNGSFGTPIYPIFEN